MLNDPQAFLRYFDGIHRRTVRDIQALPAPAESWAPPAGEGENAWSIAPDRASHLRVADVLRAGLPQRGVAVRLGSAEYGVNG